ncbi:MAG: hypothetical protein J6Y45_01375, partial [Bacteroidales bacterium]|nr:hypothetical protein [Bacteroidales bacterium]
MKRYLVFLSLFLSSACLTAKTVAPDIMPAPRSLEMAKGNFKMKGVSINCDPSLEARTLKAVRQFADRLTLVSGKTVSVASPIGLQNSVKNGAIRGLCFVNDAS